MDRIQRDKTSRIVLKAGLEAARLKKIPVVVVASTTGRTASLLCDEAGDCGQRLIVVTSGRRRGRIPEDGFAHGIQDKLRRRGVEVVAYPRSRTPKKLRRALIKVGILRWERHLGRIRAAHGSGMRICHKIVRMLAVQGIIKEERVVAVAGRKAGADTAVILVTRGRRRWPVLEEAVTAPANDE